MSRVGIIKIVSVVGSGLLGGFLAGFLGLVAGAIYGGNHAVNFQFNGQQGYEATGQLGAMIGFALGALFFSWSAARRSIDKEK